MSIIHNNEITINNNYNLLWLDSPPVGQGLIIQASLVQRSPTDCAASLCVI